MDRGQGRGESLLGGAAGTARVRRSTAAWTALLALGAAVPGWARADRLRHDNDGGEASSRSTTIALAEGGRKLVAVNLEAHSVTVFRVSGDSLQKLAEVPVGREPRCVAVSPRGDEAFVTNSGDGTVSVLSLRGHEGPEVVATISVGVEPRACALTSKGEVLYVANYTAGTLTLVDTTARKVVGTIFVGGNPGALAIAKDSRTKEKNVFSSLARWRSRGGEDRVFVTQFFARPIPGGPGEGFDDGRQGVVQTFLVSNPAQITEIVLSPLAESGFTANRTNLCQQLNPAAVNNTFCPDPTAPAGDPRITQDPQAVFPNQLGAALVCGKKLYLPSIGAQPEPPVFFNVNVQALVHVVDTAALQERTELHVNLNAQIATEAAPANPIGTLQRAFGNDIVAIDSDEECKDFFLVSRGGNYVLRASIGADGRLDIGAPQGVVRLQTGNIPDGIVVDRRTKKAYVNNQVNLSVSVLDLRGNTVIARDVPSGTPPEPGSFDHARLLGKLVFFTALGVPDNGLVGTQIRAIDPVEFRGKQSADAWSSCASCHPDGLTDSVTWIFADGPRQAIPLDGLYSKLNGAHDTRINNWSAVRDSVTDFNNNSRNVQCGTGFAGGGTNTAIGCPPFAGFGAPLNPAVFDHGLQQGASEALDFETTWAQTVRPLNEPPGDPGAVMAGAQLFQSTCASCHGGAKWTKSQIIYLSNPALDRPFAAGGTPRDPGLNMVANQSVSYRDPRVDPGVLTFLENVGTFDPANPIEVRQNGAAPLGSAGFNEPSLLGVNSSAPYFHNGQAQTLADVFDQHALPGGATISGTFGPGDLGNLETFLRTIDGRTPIFRSQTDDFKDPFVNMVP